jgi:signal transduction histidine kinase
MKKYIISLLVLILIGGVLAYVSFQENKLLDDQVYLDSTVSVRNLKIIDSDLNIELFGVRYENKNFYDDIDGLLSGLSEEFDNLRFEALFEEIESSPELSLAVTRFEEELLEKQEHIEAFIDNHRSLVEANALFADTAKINSPINQITNKLSLQADVISINISFYRYLENSSDENKTRLNDGIALIGGMIENYSEDDQAVIYGYIKVLSDIIILTEEMQKNFTLSIMQATGDRLNELASAYVTFHNNAIEKSNTIRNALTLYGVVLLILLIIFAYLLRKQYLGLEQQVADRTEEIQQAYTELQESQEQLIQSEKMASLGEMVAGVAHEINTPLGYVNSNISTIHLNLNDITSVMGQLALLKTAVTSRNRDNKKVSSLLVQTLKSYSLLQNDDIFDESQQLLDDSAHGLSEISKLVMSLKDFSRLDRQSTDEVDIHDCIENSLKIATNHIRENNVTVKKVFADLPNMVCTPSKLNQLFLNIITNASQAMKQEGGNLTIQTQLKNDSIVVAFSDQGVGMDEETSQKMFDPFFTSKPIGEGTGLGMSIAYKIVQAHHGKIQVKSQPNVGTTIAIQLPIEQPAS